jgi:hypothetical protein
MLEIVREMATKSTDGLINISYAKKAAVLSNDGIEAKPGKIHEILLDLKSRGKVSDTGGAHFSHTVALVRIPGLVTEKEEVLLDLIRSSQTGEPPRCNLDFNKVAAAFNVQPGIVHAMTLHLRDERLLRWDTIGHNGAIGVRLIP